MSLDLSPLGIRTVADAAAAAAAAASSLGDDYIDVAVEAELGNTITVTVDLLDVDDAPVLGIKRYLVELIDDAGSPVDETVHSLSAGLGGTMVSNPGGIARKFFESGLGGNLEIVVTDVVPDSGLTSVIVITPLEGSANPRFAEVTFD